MGVLEPASGDGGPDAAPTRVCDGGGIGDGSSDDHPWYPPLERYQRRAAGVDLLSVQQRSTTNIRSMVRSLVRSGEAGLMREDLIKVSMTTFADFVAADPMGQAAKLRDLSLIHI